jgi:hypothetical protein
MSREGGPVQASNQVNFYKQDTAYGRLCACVVSGVVKRAQSIETSPLRAAHGIFWRCAWFPVDCAHFHRTAHHPRVLEPTTGQPGECVRFGCWIGCGLLVRQCVDLSWGGGRFATVPPAVSPSMIFPLCTRLEPSRGGVVGEFFRAANETIRSDYSFSATHDY